MDAETPSGQTGAEALDSHPRSYHGDASVRSAQLRPTPTFHTQMDAAQIDGVDVALSRARRGTLLLPWDGRGARRVELSARAFRGGATSFRLGDVEVSADLPTDGSYTEPVLDLGESLPTRRTTSRRSARWRWSTRSRRWGVGWPRTPAR